MSDLSELSLADAVLELQVALRESTPGRWCKGMTSHHTVAKFTTGRKPYAIGEFHHAADASFVDACHELLPILLADYFELLKLRK